MAEAEQNEKVAKDFFLKLVEEACPDVSPEECWRLFNRDCLAPLVQQLGARTYEVVSGTRQNVESNITSPLFFEHYESDLRQRLRTAVVNFFDPKNPAVRAYVLSYMNAGFFLEATALTGEALERLAARRETPPQFFVFLDTNCLFSVLDLHDNPSNEAVVSLVDLMQRISPRVPSTLYVSLQTIEEAKRVLYGRKEGLKGVPPVLNVSKAVVQTGMAEGVTLRYFRACEEAKAPLDLDLYFNPYLTNFNSIIREKRIELYNHQMAGYSTRQDVIDDIMWQIDYEKPKPEVLDRRYRALEHDRVLWHFVHDKRSTPPESMSGESYWIVTIDYNSIGFDARKRRRSSFEIPLCVDPATLIQVMQFWEPRTTEFEEALIGTFRLPFQPQEFTAESERTTLRILTAIARYENVGDLSIETIAHVLTNDVVRQKLLTAESADEEFKVVNEVFRSGSGNLNRGISGIAA